MYTCVKGVYVAYVSTISQLNLELFLQGCIFVITTKQSNQH